MAAVVTATDGTCRLWAMRTPTKLASSAARPLAAASCRSDVSTIAWLSAVTVPSTALTATMREPAPLNSATATAMMTAPPTWFGSGPSGDGPSGRVIRYPSMLPSSSPARMPTTRPSVCSVRSRMRPAAVSANPSIASWAAPTTVSPDSISTMPDATMMAGCTPAKGSTSAAASADTITATTVVTKAPAIWLKKDGTRSRASPDWVAAAPSAATNVSPTSTADPPDRMLAPTASRARATTTTGCR